MDKLVKTVVMSPGWTLSKQQTWSFRHAHLHVCKHSSTLLLVVIVILSDSTEKYDSRDVERLQNEDALVEGYLTWRLYVVDDALKMIDESLQWRKEFGVNGTRQIF